jgi:hypothetical protein
MKVNSNIVTEPARVREEVLKYYANVYETRGNKAEIEEDFFNAISTLEKDAQDMCDTPLSLSLSELTEAVNRTSKRKSPGMDRLTYEFYEQFWPITKALSLKMYTRVFNRDIYHSPC